VIERPGTQALSGRVVLITGGARGLGREMALALAHQGARLCITGSAASDVFDATIAALSQIAGEENFLACVSDVADPVAVDDLVARCLDKFGRIDVLVNNAGRGMRLISETFNTVPTKFWQADAAGWSQIVDTNINGPFLLTRAIIPQMLTQKFGKIINISTSAQTMIRKGYSPYGPTKAFLEAASRAWAADLDGTGIDVNVLLPGGAADTDLLPPSADKKGADGNLLAADVMCDAVVWLASDQSNGISGGRFIGRFWGDDEKFRDDAGNMPQLM
jgi:NAD(P)-dependent dehydrogenase (short-subunit alcohol dehydrogenase family)